MKRFALLAGLMIVTLLGLALTTDWVPGALVSQGTVLGLPVVAMDAGTPAWLSIGGGVGVVVLGVGFGVVAFTVYGAGVLFGTGQVSAGLISFAQAGIGVVLFLGQVGAGLVGGGQVVVGLLGWAQGRLALNGEKFIQGLNDDAGDLFRFR